MDEKIEEIVAQIRANIELSNQFTETVLKLFTREDVNGLRHIASLLEGEAKRQLVISIANRIDLLIPPTDGTQ